MARILDRGADRDKRRAASVFLILFGLPVALLVGALPGPVPSHAAGTGLEPTPADWERVHAQAWEATLASATAQWPRRQGRWVQLISGDPGGATVAQVDSLESSLLRLAARLGDARRMLQPLRARPLRYFHAQGQQQMELLVAGEHEGLALPGLRVVISRRLPHEHELVHLLSHLAIAPAPPGQEALLQEGLASWMAGAAGLSPAALSVAAERALALEPGLPRQLLGGGAFAGSPHPDDVRYAVAARFVEYMVDRFGLPAFLRAYRLTAGLRLELAQRPAAHALAQLEGELEVGREEILAGFDRWRRAHPARPLRPFVPPARRPDMQWEDEALVARLWGGEEWSVDLTAERGAPSGRLLLHEAGRSLRLVAGPEQIALYDGANGQFLLQLRGEEEVGPWRGGEGEGPRWLRFRLPAAALGLGTLPERGELAADPAFRY